VKVSDTTLNVSLIALLLSTASLLPLLDCYFLEVGIALLLFRHVNHSHSVGHQVALFFVALTLVSSIAPIAILLSHLVTSDFLVTSVILLGLNLIWWPFMIGW
jgi:hypothetical protein